MIYVPDDLIAKVISTAEDKQMFVKESIEEKLERENNK